MSDWIEELEVEVQRLREEGRTYNDIRTVLTGDLDERIRVCSEEETMINRDDLTPEQQKKYDGLLKEKE